MSKGVYVRTKSRKISWEEANSLGLPCHRGHTGAWSKYRDRSRYCLSCHTVNSLKSRYGISEEEYKRLEANSIACEICGIRPKKLFVDHDHVTKEIRGMLCNRCNLRLGLIESGFLLESQKYLQKYKSSPEPVHTAGRTNEVTV